jgi:hypothetical protein
MLQACLQLQVEALKSGRGTVTVTFVAAGDTWKTFIYSNKFSKATANPTDH